MINSLTHHAYGIAGECGEVVPKLFSALKESSGINALGNPDFRVESYDVMGVHESRALKESAGRKAVSGGKKIFVICARGITKEAQNALLKVFEEPPKSTHFFLIVPSLDMLLPTLRSRLSLLRSDVADERRPSSLAEDFLHSAIPARLKTINKLLKSAEEETGKRELIAFLDEIERNLAIKDRNIGAVALEELFKVKKYVRDRAPSFKLLLEHLALVLPRAM